MGPRKPVAKSPSWLRFMPKATLPKAKMNPAEPACILANFFLRPPNCDKDNHQKDARCTKLKLQKDPIKSIVKTDTTTVKNTINKNIKTVKPKIIWKRGTLRVTSGLNGNEQAQIPISILGVYKT